MLEASAKIDVQVGAGSNALQHLIIDNMFGLSPIKVDQVQAGNAGIGKALSHLQGVFIVDLFLCVVALGQADTLAINNVNCGYDVHDL